MRTLFYATFMVLIICNASDKPQFPDELKEIIQMIHDTCVEKTGVSEQAIKDCETGKFADDRSLKCYMFCLMEEASFVNDDGSIDYDMLCSMVPESWRTKFENMINACKHLDKPGKDGCERAFDVHVCLQKNDPDIYYLF